MWTALNPKWVSLILVELSRLTTFAAQGKCSLLPEHPTDWELR